MAFRRLQRLTVSLCHRHQCKHDLRESFCETVRAHKPRAVVNRNGRILFVDRVHTPCGPCGLKSVVEPFEALQVNGQLSYTAIQKIYDQICRKTNPDDLVRWMIFK